MQALIYNPFANKQAGFKNVLSIAVAFFSGGISAHAETKFTANQEMVDFFSKHKVFLKGKRVRFNLEVDYVINMTTKGLVIESWKSREAGLKKKWKGVVDAYNIDDGDLTQLCWDIKSLCERNAKYSFVEAFYPSTDNTLFGKIMQIGFALRDYFVKKLFGRKVKPADFCSEVTTITYIKTAKKYRKEVAYKGGFIYSMIKTLTLNLADPKHFKAAKEFAKRQTPKEQREILENLYTKEQFIFD